MAYYPEEGTLSISYDVSTVGGLTKENFADVVSWWDDIMGIAYRFFEDNPAPEEAAPAAEED